MTDFLALLDRAIGDLDPENGYLPDNGRGTATDDELRPLKNATKPLITNGLAVMAVMAVEKQDVLGDDCSHAENIFENPPRDGENDSQFAGVVARRVSYQERRLRPLRPLSSVSAGKAVAVALPGDDHLRPLRPLSKVSAGFDGLNLDDLAKRAAIIEEQSGCPPAWAEGLATLTLLEPLPDFSRAQWTRVVDGACIFMDLFGREAAACGWSDLDVFGCHPTAPSARFDCAGLAMLLDRCEVVSIDGGGADLVSKTAERVRSRFYRRAMPAETVNLCELCGQ